MKHKAEDSILKKIEIESVIILSLFYASIRLLSICILNRCNLTLKILSGKMPDKKYCERLSDS